jgi:hypothetical protein
MGREVEILAAFVKLRLECKAGQLLAAEHLRGGIRKSGCHATRPTLKDLRISHHQSARWQRMAAVPRGLFETYLREATMSNGPTASGLLRFAEGRCSTPGTSRSRPS